MTTQNITESNMIKSKSKVSTSRILKSRFFRMLSKSRTGILGLIIVLLVISCAIFAPLIAPYEPTKINTDMLLAAPAWLDGGSMAHLLGTDHLGRDILSRIIYGSRISLLVGGASVIVAGIVGVTFGLLSGYFGGIIDSFFMRLADSFLALPTILFALVFLTVLEPGILTLIFILGVTNWVIYARLVRGDTLVIREKEYVKAAKSMGVSDFKIITRHILPNIFSSVIIVSTLTVASTIIAESSLSFLGLGVQVPDITWGIMLSEGRDYLATSWWIATFPGIAITITVLGIIFLGEWLRDYLDPKSV